MALKPLCDAKKKQITICVYTLKSSKYNGRLIVYCKIVISSMRWCYGACHQYSPVADPRHLLIESQLVYLIMQNSCVYIYMYTYIILQYTRRYLYWTHV